MSQNDWWIDFFDGVQSECTLTSNPQEVVDFITKHCSPQEYPTLLDLCCGKGNIAHGLSQAGYNVTGVDTSTYFIQAARQQFENSSCQFAQADVRHFRMDHPVDLALNWHTSFAYCEDDQENMAFLAAMSHHLKIGGKFILSTLNPDYILANFQRYLVKQISYQEGTIITIRESFVEEKMLKSNWLFIFPDGSRMERFGQTKLYSLADFTAMLSHNNLLIENAFGNLGFEAFTPHSPSLILCGRKVSC